MRENTWEDKRVLVTGASSGIGRCFALDVAARGATVIGVSHDAARLASAEEELRALSPKSFVQRADLAIHDEIDEMAAAVRERVGGVDVLVNNAGVGFYKTFADLSRDEVVRLIDVNLTSAVLCTHAFINGMIEQRSGTVLNIASIAGRLPLTPIGVYAAAKHGIFGFTKTLEYEVADFGVKALVLCPGRVETPFFDHETFQAREQRAETRYTVPVERVSKAMMRAIEQGKRTTFVPRTIGVLTWGWNAFPWLGEPVFRRLNIARVRTYYGSKPEGDRGGS